MDDAAREPRAKPGDRVTLEWNMGDVILDEYEVKAVLGEGGMGKVYRVYHWDWDPDMEARCSKPDLYRSQTQKETGTCEPTYSFDDDAVLCASFSMDGDRAILGTRSGRIHLCPLDDSKGAVVTFASQHDSPVRLASDESGSIAASQHLTWSKSLNRPGNPVV